jgi:class 3 adenylate cyclase
VASYSRAEVAQRAGVTNEEVSRLVELGILSPGEDDRFSTGDVRRAGLVQSLEAGGIPVDRLADAIRRGELDIGFMDDPAYERFATLSGETFREVSERTGIPLELLMVMREAIGSALPSADDHIREDELAIVPLIKVELEHGFRPIAIERFLRTTGDSLRRVAETEGNNFYSEVLAPLLAAGHKASDIGPMTKDLSEAVGPVGDSAVLAIYHAQSAHAWTANIIEGFETALARAGLVAHLERPPAMCFLDITGYTRLTQERGDEAAAALAAQLARLVQRTSVRHGGRPVKWLGDGVMFFFKDAGPGVVAALEMVDGVAGAGLPPAHVGLHAGPVIFQEGDYYGQTVNVASRIAEYARPGEVLVSQSVVEAATGTEIAFRDIGPVELKGVAGAMRLHAASLAGT